MAHLSSPAFAILAYSPLAQAMAVPLSVLAAHRQKHCMDQGRRAGVRAHACENCVSTRQGGERAGGGRWVASARRSAVGGRGSGAGSLLCEDERGDLNVVEVQLRCNSIFPWFALPGQVRSLTAPLWDLPRGPVFSAEGDCLLSPFLRSFQNMYKKK